MKTVQVAIEEKVLVFSVIRFIVSLVPSKNSITRPISKCSLAEFLPQILMLDTFKLNFPVVKIEEYQVALPAGMIET